MKYGNGGGFCLPCLIILRACMDCRLKRVLKRVLKDNIKYCIGNVKRCIENVKRCIGIVKSVLKIIITFLGNTNGPKRVLKHKPKHKPYRA